MHRIALKLFGGEGTYLYLTPGDSVYRAFISLYVLIVASVIVTGVGLNALWGWFAPDDALTQSDKDLLTTIESAYQSSQPSQPTQSSPELSQYRSQTMGLGSGSTLPLETLLPKELFARVSVFTLNDFVATEWEAALRLGEPVVVFTQEGQRQLYKRVGGAETVVRLTQPIIDNHHGTVRTWLVVGFYGAIAVMVFLWVWPLSRDLRKLESQTRLIGQDHLENPVSIAPTSPVRALAASFNRMSSRVKALLASHKEMTSAVSHELRTPLARMKFALEMAKNTQDPKALAQQLDSVKEDVADMDTLVNQLLAYAGFEQSSQSLDQQPGDMTYLLERLCTRAEQDFTDRHIQFSVENRLAKRQEVTCEWHLMEVALHNLIQNAGRFARSQVVVSLEENAGAYRLVVSDDGPGIEKEEQRRVFESFVRLSNHTNAKRRGFGLGLAIVQRVVAWHQGQVSVCNGALGGAEFTIRWPKP